MEKMAEASSDFVINVQPDLPPAEYWSECCIYRVPKQLRKVNKEAYTPKLVSIGPFHHGKKELRDMEMHKLRYFKEFLYRTGKRQEDLLKIIQDNEVNIRHCYSEDCMVSSREFEKMILLDAIFIIELFLKVNSINEATRREKTEEKKDYILRKPWLVNGIHDDLILLENQLPFFVLEKLYTPAFNDSSSLSHQQEGQQIKEHQGDLNKEDTPFLKLSRYFFSHYDKHEESDIGGEVKHFTDLIRYMVCSVPNLIQEPPIKYLHNLYSATKLEYAGLIFKAVKKRCLLDITFSKNEFLEYFPCFNLSWLLSFLPCLKCFPRLNGMQSILEVPSLTIYYNTEALFRNVMALEQCHYPFNTYICNYVMLMHYLIKTEKDADLLVEKKVIVNYIGSNDEVATLFDNLCIQIGEVTSCYHDLGRKLNMHYDHRWNHTLAVLRNMYFGDFGRGIATVAALLTLLSIFVPFLTDIGSKRN